MLKKFEIKNISGEVVKVISDTFAIVKLADVATFAAYGKYELGQKGLFQVVEIPVTSNVNAYRVVSTSSALESKFDVISLLKAQSYERASRSNFASSAAQKEIVKSGMAHYWAKKWHENNNLVQYGPGYSWLKSKQAYLRYWTFKDIAFNHPEDISLEELEQYKDLLTPKQYAIAKANIKYHLNKAKADADEAEFCRVHMEGYVSPWQRFQAKDEAIVRELFGKEFFLKEDLKNYEENIVKVVGVEKGKVLLDNSKTIMINQLNELVDIHNYKEIEKCFNIAEKLFAETADELSEEEDDDALTRLINIALEGINAQ